MFGGQLLAPVVCGGPRGAESLNGREQASVCPVGSAVEASVCPVGSAVEASVCLVGSAVEASVCPVGSAVEASVCPVGSAALQGLGPWLGRAGECRTGGLCNSGWGWLTAAAAAALELGRPLLAVVLVTLPGVVAAGLLVCLPPAQCGMSVPELLSLLAVAVAVAVAVGL